MKKTSQIEKSIDINGENFVTDETDTLLSLAAKHGFYIPHSCKDGRCNEYENPSEGKGF